MSTSQEPLQNIIKEIESKTEKKVENLFQGKNPIQEIRTNAKTADGKTIGDTLVNIMSEGADEFKAKTGRNMTYSEMRQMYG